MNRPEQQPAATTADFTDRELARAARLRSADVELADVALEDIAEFLRDAIPPAAYEHPA
jgi:hypothetical protein